MSGEGRGVVYVVLESGLLGYGDAGGKGVGFGGKEW
jgi:hypothetical protein